jgi:hypothetical protein
MVQTIIVGTLVIASMYYLVGMVRKALKGEASCGGGCAKCSVTEPKTIPAK